MKRSGQAAAAVLKRIGEAIVPGVSTCRLGTHFTGYNR